MPSSQEDAEQTDNIEIHWMYSVLDMRSAVKSHWFILAPSAVPSDTGYDRQRGFIGSHADPIWGRSWHVRRTQFTYAIIFPY